MSQSKEQHIQDAVQKVLHPECGNLNCKKETTRTMMTLKHDYIIHIFQTKLKNINLAQYVRHQN